MENKIEPGAGENRLVPQPAAAPVLQRQPPSADVHGAPVYAAPAPAVAPSQLPKYLSLLVALIIVTGTGVALYSLNLTRQAAKGVADFFQPKVKYNAVLGGAIGQLNNNPKLVVLTANIDATSAMESTRTFAGVPYGSATVEIKAPAKVQFYLPLSSKDFGINDIYYDQLGKRLVVTIPRPVLDTELVSIESDPAKIEVRTDLGWSPFSRAVADIAIDKAKGNLKESVLNLARHELLQERAEKNAKEHVANFIGNIKDALKENDLPLSEKLKSDGVRLEVEFKKL